MLSDKFLARLKTSETPAYRLAQRVGRHPTWLSRVVPQSSVRHGYEARARDGA